MYGWIWRKLPFGVPGKVIGSFVLVAAVVAALWLWGFPTAEPLLPFDDVNVTDPGGGTPGEAPGPAGVDPSGGLPGDHDLPYSTEENEPSPQSSR
jgi:hypothetical protein